MSETTVFQNSRLQDIQSFPLAIFYLFLWPRNKSPNLVVLGKNAEFLLLEKRLGNAIAVK